MWLIIIIALWVGTSLSVDQYATDKQVAKAEAMLKKIRKDKLKTKRAGQGGRSLQKKRK